MKLSTVVGLVASVCLSIALAEDSYGQKFLEKQVTISLKSKSLQGALDEIASKSGAKLVFSDAVVANRPVANRSFQKAKVAEILAQLLDPLGLEFATVGEMIVVRERSMLLADAQPLRVQPIPRTGVVTDSLGQPLVGVTVRDQTASNVVTSTDAEGHFDLQVGDDAVLVFSLVGYLTQEVPVAGRKQLNVVLRADNTGLDEVVVIGYGQRQSKLSVTGVVPSESENI